MKDNKREIRKERLAKLLYEMGMEVDLVSKVSGIEIEKIIKDSYKCKFKNNYD